MVEARADTITILEALRVWEDSLNRSLVEEAVTTTATTSMATNTDLPAVEDLVRLRANSLVETATTTSNTLATTTTMDHREALVDLQAWQAHSWEAAALPTTTSLADSTDRTRTTAMAAATSNNMDLTKATVAAVAEASSATSWVEASQTAALVATATLQEEDPAVLTLALRHQAHTSPKDSPTTANLVKVTALTLALRHQTHTSLRDNQTTAHLVQVTALTMVPRPRALHRNLARTTRLAAINHTDSNLTVDHHKADMEDTSNQTPMADLLSSTVAMTKAVTAALVVQVVTTSNREVMANLKADTVDNTLLLEATAVGDTSSMATPATEGDNCRACYFLNIERRRAFCGGGSLTTVHENACAHD